MVIRLKNCAPSEACGFFEFISCPVLDKRYSCAVMYLSVRQNVYKPPGACNTRYLTQLLYYIFRRIGRRDLSSTNYNLFHAESAIASCAGPSRTIPAALHSRIECNVIAVECIYGAMMVLLCNAFRDIHNFYMSFG